MVRFLSGIVVGILVATVTFSEANPQVVKMIVNGKSIEFPDAPPQIINGRVMIPARPLAEALGASVQWDTKNATVIVTSKGMKSMPDSISNSTWNGETININNVFEIGNIEFQELNSFNVEFIGKHIGGDRWEAAENNKLLLFRFKVINKTDKYQEFGPNNVNNTFKLVPLNKDGRSWYFRPVDLDYSKLNENKYLAPGDVLSVNAISEIPKDVEITQITVPKHMVGLPSDLIINVSR